ncbi:hypothetical protein D3C85_1893890 [compost metagenome]
MVFRKFSLAVITRPSGVNSITAMERPMAASMLAFSCSLLTFSVMSVATLITLLTCRSGPNTGM